MRGGPPFGSVRTTRSGPVSGVGASGRAREMGAKPAEEDLTGRRLEVARRAERRRELLHDVSQGGRPARLRAKPEAVGVAKGPPECQGAGATRARPAVPRVIVVFIGVTPERGMKGVGGRNRVG